MQAPRMLVDPLDHRYVKFHYALFVVPKGTLNARHHLPAGRSLLTAFCALIGNADVLPIALTRCDDSNRYSLPSTALKGIRNAPFAPQEESETSDAGPLMMRQLSKKLSLAGSVVILSAPPNQDFLSSNTR